MLEYTSATRDSNWVATLFAASISSLTARRVPISSIDSMVLVKVRMTAAISRFSFSRRLTTVLPARRRNVRHARARPAPTRAA